jgi:hypothetical protein
MADKRISQLVDRGTVVNSDVVPIVVSGAVTTNKATISSIQTFMQGNLDLGVTSVGITLGSSGTDVSVSGSPITSSGNITINIPTASATNRGALSSADWSTFNSKQGAITLTTTGTSGASTLVGNTLNIPNYTTDLSGYVTLGTAQTITAQKTFTTSGSSDTMIISHGSGSGFALDVIKAGNGEAIRVQKTSGSGNAMTISGGNFEAGTIVKTGGTSSQFLKADGSVDSSTYLTTGSAASTYLPLAGGTLTGALNGTSAAFTGAVSGSAVTITATTGIAGDFTNNSSTNETLRARNNGSGNIAAFRNLSAEVASITNSGGLTLSGALSGTSANFTGSVGIGTITPEGSGLTVASGGILVSLDPGANRKVLELYATSTGAKVSSSYVGASSYGSLELLTSGLARLTIADTGAATFSSSVDARGDVTIGSRTADTDSKLEFANGTDAQVRIIAQDFATDGRLGFWLNEPGVGFTERMVIKRDTGNVGIGVSSLVSPGGSRRLLQISNSTNGALIALGSSTSESNNPRIVSNQFDLVFAAGVTTGNILFYTNDTEKIRVTTDGLTFNGDTAAANALDDYEEGTWTMGVSFGGSSTGVTFSRNTGYYTKVGNMVNVVGYFILSNKGSSIGAALITGLPYNVRSGVDSFQTGSKWLNTITFTGFPQIYANEGGTSISFEECIPATGVVAALTNANFTNSSQAMINITYRTS